jgi:putative membrane protein insertion efficiency factor
MGYCDSSAHDSRNGGIFVAGGGTGEINSTQTVTPSRRDPVETNPRSIGTWVLLALVSFYRIFLSHFFGGACKFYPSCSKYAQEAIARHGARRGAALALRRLGRCRPFTKGGFDPVPDKEKGKACGVGIPFATNSAAANSPETFSARVTANARCKRGEERVL